MAALWPKLEKTSFVNRTSQELLWRQCYCWSGQFYGSGHARHWWPYNSIHLLHEFEGNSQTISPRYGEKKKAVGNCCPKPKAADLKTGQLSLNKQHLGQLNAWISQVCLKHATIHSVIFRLSQCIITTCVWYHHDWNIRPSAYEVKWIKHFQSMTINLVEHIPCLLVLSTKVFFWFSVAISELINLKLKNEINEIWNVYNYQSFKNKRQFYKLDVTLSQSSFLFFFWPFIFTVFLFLPTRALRKSLHQWCFPRRYKILCVFICKKRSHLFS